ncbi:MAG: NUDIX hydrolase [Candidatus Nanopelagicales bacterium]
MSLRSDVRAVLSAWTPPDNAQAALRDDYVAFVDAHDDAVSRACVPGHITASALVISPDRRRVLLTLHPKVGLWLQMGGHLEPGDAGLRAAAAREALEESGIPGLRLGDVPLRLDRHRVTCHGGSDHLDVQYVAVAPADAVHVMSEESLDLAWFDVDALPDLTDDALRRLVHAAL